MILRALWIDRHHKLISEIAAARIVRNVKVGRRLSLCPRRFAKTAPTAGIGEERVDGDAGVVCATQNRAHDATAAPHNNGHQIADPALAPRGP